MKMLKSFVLAFCVMQAAIGQDCFKESSAPLSLIDTGIGVVQQVDTGLEWMKCNLGEQWDGQRCAGEPLLLDFVEASAHAKKTDILGRNNWRLPTRDELMALTDSSCRLPAINMDYFPTTKSTQYWTSERYSFFAHVVSFDHGYTFSTQMKFGKHVRLVRGDR